MKLQDLWKTHNCHPMKSLVMPLVQAPVFISFFIGLRRMTELPIPTMSDGGILWFTDLTSPDPYYILPALSTISMLLTVELSGNL